MAYANKNRITRISSAEKSFKSDFVQTKVIPHTKIEKAAKKKPAAEP